jgi:protein-L-isoaspartate(D-aspartate) O-methyltransferase
LAYADLEIPLGHGEKMMKPVVEGRTLQALKLQADEDVLEIGTGSGYLSACLGSLAREVVSLEIRPEFAAAARARLDARQLGGNIRIETADALQYETDRRFDAICVTGAVAVVPARFAQWLRPGGRLFVIRGRSPAMEAVLQLNDVNGLRIESLFETDIPYLVGAAPAPQFVF